MQTLTISVPADGLGGATYVMPDNVDAHYRLLCWGVIASFGANVGVRTCQLEWSAQGADLLLLARASVDSAENLAFNWFFGPWGGSVVSTPGELVPVEIILAPGDTLSMVIGNFEVGEDSANFLSMQVEVLRC